MVKLTPIMASAWEKLSKKAPALISHLNVKIDKNL
jgi:hypothetical protein